MFAIWIVVFFSRWNHSLTCVFSGLIPSQALKLCKNLYHNSASTDSFNFVKTPAKTTKVFFCWKIRIRVYLKRIQLHHLIVCHPLIRIIEIQMIFKFLRIIMHSISAVVNVVAWGKTNKKSLYTFYVYEWRPPKWIYILKVIKYTIGPRKKERFYWVKYTNHAMSAKKLMQGAFCWVLRFSSCHDKPLPRTLMTNISAYNAMKRIKKIQQETSSYKTSP